METKGVNMSEHKLKIKECADLMGTTPETIRILMDTGKLNIGYVINHKSRNTYIIVKELFERETGIRV